MNPMPKFFRLAGLAGAVACAVAGSAVAQPAPKPETLIKQRQSAFQVIAWNSGRIKSSLDGSYNKEQVLKSAAVIAAIASSGLGSLFAPGTESGKGWHDTTAKPELFTNGAHFAELGGALAKESTELVRVVSSGADAAAVKDQFGKLQHACKACHDDFRNTN
jgi:cytochrome c556